MPEIMEAKRLNPRFFDCHSEGPGQSLGMAFGEWGQESRERERSNARLRLARSIR